MRHLFSGGLVVLGLLAFGAGRVDAADYMRGDVNSDGELSISDPYALLAMLFSGLGVPDCRDAWDFDADGADLCAPDARLGSPRVRNAHLSRREPLLCLAFATPVLCCCPNAGLFHIDAINQVPRITAHWCRTNTIVQRVHVGFLCSG